MLFIHKDVGIDICVQSKQPASTWILTQSLYTLPMCHCIYKEQVTAIHSGKLIIWPRSETAPPKHSCIKHMKKIQGKRKCRSIPQTNVLNTLLYNLSRCCPRRNSVIRTVRLQWETEADLYFVNWSFHTDKYLPTIKSLAKQIQVMNIEHKVKSRHVTHSDIS